MHLHPFLAAATPARSSFLLSLSPIDFVITTIYFVTVLGIGFYLKKFASTGEDFFMAGRKMRAWIAGLRLPLQSLRVLTYRPMGSPGASASRYAGPTDLQMD